MENLHSSIRLHQWVGDYILSVPAALNRNQCEEVIGYFDNNPQLQVPGNTLGGNVENEKISIDLSLPNDSFIDEFLFNSLADALHIYKLRNPAISNFLEVDSGYMIQVSHPGGRYNYHADGPLYDSRRKWMRVLGAIWYLNDVPVKNGGATKFFDHGIQVQPTEGRLIVFPANWTHPHAGLEVKKGVKYIVTTFISSNKEAIL